MTVSVQRHACVSDTTQERRVGVVRDGGSKTGQGRSETARHAAKRAEKEAISYLNTRNSNAESGLV